MGRWEGGKVGRLGGGEVGRWGGDGSWEGGEAGRWGGKILLISGPNFTRLPLLFIVFYVEYLARDEHFQYFCQDTYFKCKIEKTQNL